MSRRLHAQVAVITPTALHPARLPFLEELYESLRAQEEVNWSWILAPNGAKADPDLIPRAITKDPRVKVVARPDPGPAPARNTALNFVEEPRCVFADDDDRLPPYSLAVRNQRADETGLSWIAGYSADWDATSDALSTWMCPTPTGQHAAGDVWTHWPDPQNTKPPLGHCMLLTDTRLAQAVGHGGLHKGEDYAFVLGVTSRAAGELIPDVVYHRRIHAGQWTAEGTYRDQAEYDARRHAWLKGRAERELHALNPSVGSAAA
ncbi:glycosyltransferase [Streptomyces sp. NPDC048638]|uniref:glycosyltransferase n=1 Tax=Streptomyces sp. NPDC048638 TaxID=3365580 RepID=UPI003717A689